MASLKIDRRNGKSYAYIQENYIDIDPDTGKKTYKKRTVKNLGVLGVDLSKKQAQIELSKHEQEFKPNRSIEFSTACHEFEEHYKKNKDIARETVKRFQDNLINLKELNRYYIDKIDYDVIEGFKTFLFNKGYTPRGVQINLMDLRKILRYCIKKKYLSHLPIIDMPKNIKKETARLSKEQVETLLDHCKTKRNSEKIIYFIKMMLYTGMRPNEFKKLKWSNVYLEEKYIHIKSKNELKKGRRIPIIKDLLPLLYERKRNDLPVYPYNNDGVNSILTRYSHQLGFTVNHYIFRKTFGSMMAESGVPIAMLASIMGNSISVCGKYYVKIEYKAMVADIERHPLSGIL